MELLFIALAGAILGLGARYLLPNRHTHGSILLPGIGVSVASILWVALTWASLAWDALAWDGGWIWWITLLGTTAVVVTADIVIGRVRSAHDRELLHSLTRAGR